MRSEIEMLRRELAACRNELDKWQAAHTDVDLEEMRLQAQQPSLAAKQAYINALRWHVAASEARERELREAVIQFDESCEICEDESINYAWAEGDPVLLAVLRSVLQAQPPHAALDAALAERRMRSDNLRKLQMLAQEEFERRGFDAGPQTLVLGAMEELGELAMALLLTECDDFQPSKKKLSPEWADARDPAREVGDCITYLLALCNRLGIEPEFKWL